MFQWNIENPNIFREENVFEYAVCNGNQKCVLMIAFNVDWKVPMKASETYMVYFWVPLGGQSIVLNSNFTGQLIHKL